MAHGRSAWWWRTIAVVGMVAIGSGFWWACSHEWIRPLEYDAATTIEVGEIDVSIRTESFAITDGDNGPARVTLATAAETVVVDSSFNNDLFSDLRPGYLSRRDVDGDGRRDLVLWIPGISGLESTTYVSGADGAGGPGDADRNRPDDRDQVLTVTFATSDRLPSPSAPRFLDSCGAVCWAPA